MKKTGILLTILLVLGIAVVAYAGAIKVSLYPDTANAGALEDPAASGFVIVNQNKQGAIAQFQVRGLTPGKQYWGYCYDIAAASFIDIGELKMNKFGSGHLHAANGPVPAGNYWFGVSDVDPDGMTAANQVLRMANPVTL
ncbi:hypothetical protein ES702_02675 [subsurface metagenome]